MPFTDGSSQLEPLLFAMKQYKNLTKSTIEITPSSGQGNYSPNQKVIFTLPYASTISLEDLALHFTFTSKNLPVATAASGGDSTCIEKITAPRDVASLISEIDIKINGQTVQHLTRYNDIVNIFEQFQNGSVSASALAGANKYKDVWKQMYTIDDASGAITPGTIDVNKDATKNVVSKKFIVNKWYGLLGARGKETSSNFIDTNMLGEVTIAFTLARASVCPSVIKPESKAQSDVSALSSGEYLAAKNARNPSYELSDVKMSMVRYNLPNSYGEALASNLSGGAKYQIAFNHYEFHTQKAGKESDTLRWNENSRDIKGLLAVFTDNERENTNLPMPYDAAMNTSPYFKYENTIHDYSQFQIGSVKMPQNVLDTESVYLENCRGLYPNRGHDGIVSGGFNNAAGTTFTYNCNGDIVEFLQYYFMAYLSLEMTEGITPEAKMGKKLLSGLSSEQLPISCSYTYKNKGANSKSWDKSVHVISLTTRMLVIENGQSVHVEI
jgi:hypothetical protein